MKSKDVLRVLRVTRPTLTKYVKLGWIKVTTLPNGDYDYHSDSVYKFVNDGTTRKTYIYADVQDKENLVQEIERIKEFCASNGYKIDKELNDYEPNNIFDKRKQLMILVDNVISNKVEKVIVEKKDSLSSDFDLLQYIFSQFNTEIIVMDSTVSN